MLYQSCPRCGNPIRNQILLSTPSPVRSKITLIAPRKLWGEFFSRLSPLLKESTEQDFYCREPGPRENAPELLCENLPDEETVALIARLLGPTQLD